MNTQSMKCFAKTWCFSCDWIHELKNGKKKQFAGISVHSFTLIELLVVIAIIAILAGEKE